MNSIDTNNGFLGELDRHLFQVGRHWQLERILGAHPIAPGGTDGYRFAVWAPNAQAVSVVGQFNDWNPDADPLQRDVSGIWWGRVAAARTGDLYKYHILDAHGQIALKADPVGFWAERPPGTASVLVELEGFEWQDAEWMNARSKQAWERKPMSIYEVHLGSWRTDPDREHGWKNYRQLADELIEYCQATGFTHLQLMPVTEHPYTPSWGYQTVGYYAPTSRYGHPHDLMYLIDACHRNGIGVLVDWVPAHFPRDAHGLRRFDGTALYEHLDPRQGEHPDWGTMIFNFGRPQVRNFLIANALFWLRHYHIDGLRVDAVASMLYLDYSRQDGEWIPNRHGGRENLEAIEFLQQTNAEVHDQHPGALMIAEESTAWPRVTGPVSEGGLGFDLKWNMGWMNDTLRYMERNPLHRTFHHNELTFSLMYAWSEQFVLPLSHDEVVHGKRSLLDKMPGDVWQRFANLRLLLAWQWLHPGKPLLFMGAEFGQWKEWNCEQPLDWNLLEREYNGVRQHASLRRLVARLNRLLQNEPALHERDFSPEGFSWLRVDDCQISVLAWMRIGGAGIPPLVVIANFTPTVHEAYPIDLPEAGTWQEIVNTDDRQFGGSHVINAHPLATRPVEGSPGLHRLSPQLPPLGAIVLKPQTGGTDSNP